MFWGLKMNRTKIESVRNPDGTPGFTWNPITGCLYHVDGMCKGGDFPCWAYKLAHGRCKGVYLANENVARMSLLKTGREQLNDPFYLRYWPDKLQEVYARNWRKPRGIFTCDMSDLFGVGVPTKWTNNVLAAIITQNRGPKASRFYLLTKQPQNLAKFSPFPDNCWVGVTATNDEMAYNAMVHLQTVNAKLKYIAFEPLLSGMSKIVLNLIAARREFDWLIIGGQTRPAVKPKVESVRELIEAADHAGIPVFLKDNLGWPRLTAEGSKPYYTKSKGTWKLRQEMPKGDSDG